MATKTARLHQPREIDTEPVPASLAPRLRDQLCFALYAGSHSLSRRYKPLLAPLGLTYPQYICLMVLWETDGITVSSLGHQLLLDSGTLTPLLKRLEKMGLVRRTRDREDERQVLIHLTEQGDALRGRVVAVRDAIVCATGLPLDELGRLRDAIVALRRHLDGQGD